MTRRANVDGRGDLTSLFTIGYERAALADFLATLIGAGVQRLIDVREVPWSRRPEFAKKALTESLAAAGIEYVHLKGLGNPKPGRDAAKSGDMAIYRRIFGAHMETPVAQSDLARLAELAGEAPSCLMCYEADPSRCHRAMVIGALADIAAFDVRHLAAYTAAPNTQEELPYGR